MTVNSRKKIQGIYYPPGDKSISHRSLILTGQAVGKLVISDLPTACLLYTSPSPRDAHESRMPSSA